MFVTLLTVRDHCEAFSGKYLQTRRRPRKQDSTQHNEAPVAEQKHTNISASGNGKRKPERIDNDIEPGMANVCKLNMAVKELTGTVKMMCGNRVRSLDY